MKFSKPGISLDDQIAQLERRGMQINDRASARHYLQHISYYRLRAYWLPFEVPVADGDHRFREGTTFEAALSLYVFDRELRLLAMDAIERVEVSIRANWAHHIAMKYGAHGHLERKIYHRDDWYDRDLQTLTKETGRSQDTFVKHYQEKYTDPVPLPVWMAAEVMSLGQLSKWIVNLKGRSDRGAIAKPYQLDEKIFVSMTHHLAYVRNICAHHGRLWNKRFTVTMMVPTAPASLKLAMNAEAKRQLYNTLATLAYLLEIVAPHSGWRGRLVDHLASCEYVDFTDMGFPQNWRDMPAWKKR